MIKIEMSTKNVLIIDDERELVDLMKLHLEKNHYHVTTASDGVVGLAKARTGLPDLIVLDISMPHMDGLEFIAKIKEMRRAKFIPVLISSGKMPDTEFKTAGVTEFLPKPYSPNEFLNKVRSMLGE